MHRTAPRASWGASDGGAAANAEAPGASASTPDVGASASDANANNFGASAREAAQWACASDVEVQGAIHIRPYPKMDVVEGHLPSADMEMKAAEYVSRRAIFGATNNAAKRCLCLEAAGNRGPWYMLGSKFKDHADGLRYDEMMSAAADYEVAVTPRKQRKAKAGQAAASRRG